MIEKQSVEFDAGSWGRRAAQEIVDEYSNAAAIDTACYRVCSFVDAAAKLALADSSVALRIGEMMDPPRSFDR
ncbi:hypothetical protein ILFOPFJJ_01500 [Ensifer psoraleae]|uniref:hypothetical protein n=1 Tax=Sinorhizobium psoraleae TaxID=520838 RepID=UPI0015697C75|nr:hypothetical protein [Sinorhizobium psoraleae]NRP70619.1 hypothetical protein [Sinorhizobium psoraleae]